MDVYGAFRLDNFPHFGHYYQCVLRGWRRWCRQLLRQRPPLCAPVLLSEVQCCNNIGGWESKFTFSSDFRLIVLNTIKKLINISRLIDNLSVFVLDNADFIIDYVIVAVDKTYLIFEMNKNYYHNLRTNIIMKI